MSYSPIAVVLGLYVFLGADRVTEVVTNVFQYGALSIFFGR